MTVDSMILSIGLLPDVESCTKIIKAARERQELLRDAARKKAVDEAWARAKRWKPGDSVWCNTEGTFIGGPIQRGDKLTVYHVQVRKRILWVSFRGKRYWFDSSGVHRYNLRTVPPKKPIDAIERKMVERVADVVAELDGAWK